MKIVAPRLWIVLALTAALLPSAAWSKEITPGMKRPELVDRKDPEYTPAAKEAKLEGTVLLKVNIGKDGVVRDVHVVEGLGMGLTEAAVNAVYHWKFKPAQEADGTPVAVDYTLTLRFQIE